MIKTKIPSVIFSYIALLSVGPRYKWEIHFQRGDVDVFLVFGSCCHTTSAGLVAKVKKHRQLDRAICCSPWGIPGLVHFKLDIPLLHWASLCPLDSLDIRACSDIALCWFLLLLLPKLEEQCEAPVTSLNWIQHVFSSLILSKWTGELNPKYQIICCSESVLLSSNCLA